MAALTGERQVSNARASAAAHQQRKGRRGGRYEVAEQGDEMPPRSSGGNLIGVGLGSQPTSSGQGWEESRPQPADPAKRSRRRWA